MGRQAYKSLKQSHPIGEYYGYSRQHAGKAGGEGGV